MKKKTQRKHLDSSFLLCLQSRDPATYQISKKLQQAYFFLPMAFKSALRESK
jgi:hypothetical protein